MAKRHIEGFWKWFWIATAGVILATIWYFVITFALSSYYEKQGNSNYYSGNYLRAIEAYKTAIEYSPYPLRLYNSLGYTHYMLYEDDKAFEAYTKGLKIDPNSSDINYNIGLLYYKKSEYEKALEHYRKVLEQKGEDAGTHYMIGTVYVSQKRFNEALDEYKKVANIEPYYPYIYNALGNVYSTLDKNKEAEKSYLKQIDLFPEDEVGYSNLYELLLTQNKPLPSKIEEAFLSRFSEDKEMRIAYDMLKILEDIAKDKEVDLDAWRREYANTSLNGWSFDKLEKWAESFSTKERQERLKEAIKIFKMHKVEEN